MNRIVLLSSALATAVFALGASAQQQTQTPAPVQQQRMSVAEIATLLESQGYSVREIELERNRYEVKMIDAKGMRIEAYLNPITGEVLPYDKRDDSYRGDDDRRYGDDD